MAHTFIKPSRLRRCAALTTDQKMLHDQPVFQALYVALRHFHRGPVASNAKRAGRDRACRQGFARDRIRNIGQPGRLWLAKDQTFARRHHHRPVRDQSGIRTGDIRFGTNSLPFRCTRQSSGSQPCGLAHQALALSLSSAIKGYRRHNSHDPHRSGGLR